MPESEQVVQKFNIGDKVKVVKYGHGGWRNKDGEIAMIDLNPEIVGSIGIVSKVTKTQSFYRYALEGIPKKHAWYDEQQLEMINKNPNYE